MPNHDPLIALRTSLAEQLAALRDDASVEAVRPQGRRPALELEGRVPQRHIPAGTDAGRKGFGHTFRQAPEAQGTRREAQVLDRDAYEAFGEAGNAFDRKTAEQLVKTLFAVGNSVDPGEAFRRFRGRDPQPQALLREMGFADATP